MNVGGGFLHVGSHHSSMIAKVLVKSVAIPTSFYFHDVEWEAPEKILKSGTYAD